MNEENLTQKEIEREMSKRNNKLKQILKKKTLYRKDIEEYQKLKYELEYLKTIYLNNMLFLSSQIKEN